MKTRPVAKAKAKARRESYKPRKYFTNAEMLGHIQDYMGLTHWTIKQVAVTRMEFGKIEHVVFYFRCIPKFKTSVSPTVHYQMYDNGTPKAGGRVGN